MQAWQQYYAAVGQAGMAAGGVPGVAQPGAAPVPATAVPQGVPAVGADVSTKFFSVQSFLATSTFVLSPYHFVGFSVSNFQYYFQF